MKISREIFSFLYQSLIDTLFPVYCLKCQTPGVWLCDHCLKKISRPEKQVCPECEKNFTRAGAPCFQCQDFFRKRNIAPPLDNLLISARYPKKLNGLAPFIHYFKYRFLVDLSQPLGKLLVETFLKNNLPLPDMIIPVPLHPRRLRWRGFNQAEKLAVFLGENLTPGFSIPVKSNLLKRSVFTVPQMSIKHYQERKNRLKGVFEVSSDWPEIKNRTILLVDDVATTGATLEECGRVLRQSGAQKIMAIVLSRQEMV